MPVADREQIENTKATLHDPEARLEYLSEPAFGKLRRSKVQKVSGNWNRNLTERNEDSEEWFILL